MTSPNGGQGMAQARDEREADDRFVEAMDTAQVWCSLAVPAGMVQVPGDGQAS